MTGGDETAIRSVPSVHPLSTERVLREFRQCTPTARWHVRARTWLLPLERLARSIPPHGRLLDMGCGHGLWINYLKLRYPELDLVGVDPDERKIAEARRTGAAQKGARFTASLEPWPSGCFDRVTVFDVLYLLPERQRRDLVRRLADALAPGGTLLVRETDRDAGWSSMLLTVEETFMTRVLGVTHGSAFGFLSAQELAELLTTAGLKVVRRDRRRERHCPNLYCVAQKCRDTS